MPSHTPSGLPPRLHAILHQALSTLPDPPPGSGLILNPLSGGSINAAYQLLTIDNRQWFVKFNDNPDFTDLFAKEASGLALLSLQNIIRIPLTIACTTLDERQLLILEWIDPSPPSRDCWSIFGEQLARLHRCSQSQFGFAEDNYMGSLHQDNTLGPSWTDFLVERRLEPQLRKACNAGLLNNTVQEHFQRLYRHLPDFFPSEPPALLHGDLWNGNFLCDANQQPVLIDPAVYYGHRSMDLAMTTLFGGFDQEFYTAYHHHYPLPPNYRQQWEIANLYPLLVHLNLFGTNYRPNILQIIQRF